MDPHVHTPVIVAVNHDPASPEFSTVERRWLLLLDTETEMGRVVEERFRRAWPPVFVYSALVRANWGPTTARSPSKLLASVTVCDTNADASDHLKTLGR